MGPIIILGMHRSGTSLISKLLAELGVFMGNDLNKHNESEQFLYLNDAILKFAHANWDFPLPVKELIQEPISYKETITYLKTEINSKRFNTNFFGNNKQAIKSETKLWGWKEPRTTVTFPFWSDIYPDAKYLFIYRNGIDVASSLYIREKKRKGLIQSPLHSVRCMKLMNAFELWSEYNAFFLEYKTKIEKKLYSFSYETFLKNPQEILIRISDFIGVKISTEKIKNITSKINLTNSNKFLKEIELIRFYQSVRNTQLMRYFGYENLD